MKEYVKPEFEIVVYNVGDVLTDSTDNREISGYDVIHKNNP